jgi:D-aminopeptidase
MMTNEHHTARGSFTSSIVALPRHPLFVSSLFLLLGVLSAPLHAQARARSLGVAPGIFQPGKHNAITDVRDVRVGQVTVDAGDSVRTGITAILPHGGNLFLERVPAAIVVGNGFGKLLGVTQVRELGELESPILLTCTLCVWRAADAMVGWMLEQAGMEQVRSINVVVGETNDGGLNDIRDRAITPTQVRAALAAADSGRCRRGASARAAAPSRSAGKGESAPPRGCSRGAWAATLSVSWSRAISAASCR